MILNRDIEKIRDFTRFYTNVIGVVDSHILESPYSLPEARILYEISHTKNCMAKKIREVIEIDEGYLSRILDRFVKKSLITKSRSKNDERAYILKLTPKGKNEFAKLNSASQQSIRQIISNISEKNRNVMIANMGEIRNILLDKKQGIIINDIKIRTKLKPGDIGYVIYLHGEIYKKEYNYGIEFETYVAKGLHEFYQTYDPHKDRVWICEHNGRIIGFLLLIKRGEAAQLRYFLIEKEYRGIGLGKKLMNLYMDFFHKCGYESSYLWTTHELNAAANLYTKNGFKLVKEKSSDAFGKRLHEQKYELILKT